MTSNGMKYFDAHCHVNFAAYNEDREASIMRAKDAEVIMNVVGTQLDTSAAALALAEAYSHVYATIGLHPIHTAKSYHDEQELGEGGKAFASRGETFDANVYEEMGKNPRVIAIGECGLDYYRCDESTKEMQKQVFIEHIKLANRLKKPLMLHIRDAYDDAFVILNEYSTVKGDVHFFAGDWETARKFLDFGFTLSFTGVITFTHDYDEVVKNAPLDMLLSETDAPYVTPAPHRGKRNESAYIPLIVRQIASIRGEDFEKVSAQIMANSKRVFALDGVV